MSQLSTLLVKDVDGQNNDFYLILAYSPDWSQWSTGKQMEKLPHFWTISFHGNGIARSEQPIKCKSKKEALTKYKEVRQEYLDKGWEDHTPGFYQGWQSDKEESDGDE